MRAFVALPALALAAVFVAHPACAAVSKKKPAGTTKAASPAGPQWAQIPPGNPHKLRKTYPIQSADRAYWPTQKAVTLAAGPFDSNCKWDRPVPKLGEAKLIIKSITPDGLRLQLIYKNGDIVERDLAEGRVGADLMWFSSTPADDWNYFVMLKDTRPASPPVPKTVDKWFEVEIFPPKGYSQICDPERPEAAVTIASVADTTAARPCEAGTGGGGEPH